MVVSLAAHLGPWAPLRRIDDGFAYIGDR
jgi:hypothetical protein